MCILWYLFDRVTSVHGYNKKNFHLMYLNCTKNSLSIVTLFILPLKLCYSIVLNYVAPLFLTCLMCKCQTNKNILYVQDVTCSQWWTFRMRYCGLYCLIHGYQCFRGMWYCNSILKTEAVSSSNTMLTTYHTSGNKTQNTNNFKLVNYSAQRS